MLIHRSRPLWSLGVALGAILLISTQAAATTFGPTTTLRTSAANVLLVGSDLAANGNKVAAAWSEFGDDAVSFVRTSSDGGATWSSKIRMDTNPTDNLRVDVCGGWWWSVFSDHQSTDASDLDSLWTRGGSYTGGFYSVGILRDAGSHRSMSSADIACVSNQRTIIGWLERDDGGPVHAKVRIDPLDSLMGPGDDFHMDLGPARLFPGIAVAGTDSSAYATWFKGAHLHLKRFAMGAGSSHPITAMPTTTVLDASGGNRVKIAADGSNVIIAYAQDGDTWVVVSHDSGATFSGPHRLVNVPAPGFSTTSYPQSIDIVGSHAVVEVTKGTQTDTTTSDETRFTSSNAGDSWSSTIAGHDGTRFGAYERSGGVTRLTETWDQTWTSPQPTHMTLWFHRQT